MLLTCQSIQFDVKFVCRLTSAVCNSRKIWNKDKCRCECKEDLINKMVCDTVFVWNPRNCDCECDKSCGIGYFLDYNSCVCRNSLVDKLFEECSNVIDENKIDNEVLNVIPSNNCAACIVYVVFLAVFLTPSVIISGVFVYFYWRSKK